MTKKANMEIQNRGRIQAQGVGVEESEAWRKRDVPNKTCGYNMIKSLKSKLNHNALKQRKSSFKKAKRFIETAPDVGWDVSSRSYATFPPYRDARVDIEIIKGRAFKDD